MSDVVIKTKQSPYNNSNMVTAPIGYYNTYRTRLVRSEPIPNFPMIGRQCWPIVRPRLSRATNNSSLHYTGPCQRGWIFFNY